MKAQIKICDFGLSTREDTAFTALGTPAFMDPFILRKVNKRNDLVNSQGYNKSADIWSLGAVCYEMLIGKRAFNGRNMEDLYHNVERGNYTIPTNLSKEVVSFINGMLQYDPDKRLTAKELSRHHFLTRNIKDFHKIDLDLMGSKIGTNGLKMNTKNNEKIWDIFNENEKILSSISSTNFLEQTPLDEAEEKNVVPQFKKNSYVNIQKLNNKGSNNNSKNQIKKIKINKVVKNIQKQHTNNNIHHNINLNINNSKAQKNYNTYNKSKGNQSKCKYLNIQNNNNDPQNENNFSFRNEYNQACIATPNVNNHNNINIYQFIKNQNNNTCKNVYNKNNYNINQNEYNKNNYNTYHIQNNYNYDIYQNKYNQNNYNYNYNTYQNKYNQNNYNYNTYNNKYNQNMNNIANNDNYSNPVFKEIEQFKI